MTMAIQPRVVFKASSKDLFEIYLDSKKHTAATGAKARVSRSVGARFSAWDSSIYRRRASFTTECRPNPLPPRARTVLTTLSDYALFGKRVCAERHAASNDCSRRPWH